MKTFRFIFIFCSLLLLANCTTQDNDNSTTTTSIAVSETTTTHSTTITTVIGKGAATKFVRGADVSWLPQMEATGYQFYNDNGVKQDCLQILKDHGVNSIRLRVWVNPSSDRASGHCSPEEVVSMAKRVNAMGFRIMIDFHYSDSWADPGKQTKPAA
ncbi:MAG TPA: glycosyl hydrolase 53 family protein, partial [Spirochaetota bacterium]|nr:glycosyl hydrolase 53 family protein [Spirochaetota bacterium]